MSTQNLHAAALRISVLHILRAAGFHSTKPSVLDTLVNLTERYMLLLATQTATHALANHNSLNPELSDIRMALTDAGILLPIQSGGEEEWKQELRRPLSEYERMAFGSLRRDNEAKRRDDQDTKDVRAFTDWVTGDRYKEIRRVAGMLPDAAATAGPGRIGGPADVASVGQDDFLTALKKRNKVAVDEERWAGTVLGADVEDTEILIEGGSVGSVEEWGRRLREKQARVAEKTMNGGLEAMETGPG